MSAAGASFFIPTAGSSESKSTTSAATDKLVSIKASTSVELIRKGDAHYEELRKGFNKRIDKYPLVIAMCSSTSDVVAAIHYAQENKLPIAIKSGGHSMEGFSSNDGGLVINLSKMNDVEFLTEHRIKVGPGCTLSRLYDQTLPKQRIIPTGSCGTVGIGGLTLGGGYGLFARKYGLTCDNLLEATLVDDKGVVHSTRNDPELLWALRGGGAGNFGVVTELIYQSHVAPTSMQAHHFKARKLDAIRAKNILEKWFLFAAQLPESCFSGFVLNGSTLNILVTNFEPHTTELQLLLEKFALETDEFRSGASDDIAKMLKHYYGSLVPVYFKNSSAGLYTTFSDIKPFIADVFEKIISTRGMIFQVNTLGGNISNANFEKNSCYPHRKYNFISEVQAYWSTSDKEQHLTNVSREILTIFSQHDIKSQYVNYCSLEFQEWQTAYYGKNYSRLQAVKRKYDAGNLIRHPQSVERVI
jgi:FAD binding domain/Berberine and berberine like